MGMYTEIIFGAGFKKNLPEQVVSTLAELAKGNDLIENIPDHPFFRAERTWLMTSGGSYYFPGTAQPKFWFDDIAHQWFLQFRSNIKNYNQEIEKFLDWIKPYIEQGSGSRNFYAIVTYEEGEPTVYYLNEKEGE